MRYEAVFVQSDDGASVSVPGLPAIQEYLSVAAG
jgi:hypothetical protein